MTDTDTGRRFAMQLEEVHAEIDASGRDDVTIIAVTKGFGAIEIGLARSQGLVDIGESYAQELQSKFDVIPADMSIHFIGRVQRNKVRKVASRVALWHSVARPEIVEEIAKRADVPEILIQIRPESDSSKDGIAAGDLSAMLELAAELDVRVRGLMAMGIHGDSDGTRESFAATRILAEQHGLAELSMGMSADYRIALDEGATMLRLGSILFGPRPAP